MNVWANGCFLIILSITIIMAIGGAGVVIIGWVFGIVTGFILAAIACSGEIKDEKESDEIDDFGNNTREGRVEGNTS